MMKRTAAIGILVSLLPLGQPLVIGTGAVLTSTGMMLAIPEKAQAESADFYFKRAYNNAEEGDYYGAISDYTKVIEINPSNIYQAYGRRGGSKHFLGDYYGAISDFNKALEYEFPNRGGVFLLRGLSKEQLGDMKGACSDFR